MLKSILKKLKWLEDLEQLALPLHSKKSTVLYRFSFTPKWMKLHRFMSHAVWNQTEFLFFLNHPHSASPPCSEISVHTGKENILLCKEKHFTPLGRRISGWNEVCILASCDILLKFLLAGTGPPKAYLMKMFELEKSPWTPHLPTPVICLLRNNYCSAVRIHCSLKCLTSVGC